jgi:hypothetical protein
VVGTDMYKVSLDNCLVGMKRILYVEMSIYITPYCSAAGAIGGYTLVVGKRRV